LLSTYISDYQLAFLIIKSYYAEINATFNVDYL